MYTFGFLHLTSSKFTCQVKRGKNREGGGGGQARKINRKQARRKVNRLGEEQPRRGANRGGEQIKQARGDQSTGSHSRSKLPPAALQDPAPHVMVFMPHTSVLTMPRQSDTVSGTGVVAARAERGRKGGGREGGRGGGRGGGREGGRD